MKKTNEDLFYDWLDQVIERHREALSSHDVYTSNYFLHMMQDKTVYVILLRADGSFAYYQRKLKL